MCMWALEVLLQQMRWERDFHECVTAAAVASMFAAAICFQGWIDWVEDLLLWKVHRSLSLSSPPAATTMRSNSWLPKQKAVSLLIKNSRQLELLYTLLKAIFQSFVTLSANKSSVPRRGVIHHLLLSLFRPSKKKSKTRRTTREKKKDLHALALGGKKLTKSFSKRRRSGAYLRWRRRPAASVRSANSLSLSRKPAQPEEPSSTRAVVVALLPRNLLRCVAVALGLCSPGGISRVEVGPP